MLESTLLMADNTVLQAYGIHLHFVQFFSHQHHCDHTCVIEPNTQ